MKWIKIFTSTVLLLMLFCFNIYADNNSADQAQETAQKKSIIEVAKEWIGTPYARSGTRFSGQNAKKGADGGADCSGVIYSIYNEAGYEYNYKSVSQFVATSGDGHFKAIPKSKLQPGDIIVWLHSYKVKHKVKYVVRVKKGKKHVRYVRYKTKYRTVRISHMALYDEDGIWTTHSRAEDRQLGEDSLSGFIRSFNGVKPYRYYHYIGRKNENNVQQDQANQADQEMQNHEVQDQVVQNQEVQEQSTSSQVPEKVQAKKHIAKPATAKSVKSTKKTKHVASKKTTKKKKPVKKITKKTTVKHTNAKHTKTKQTKKSAVKHTKKSTKKTIVKKTNKKPTPKPISAGVSTEVIMNN